MVKIMHDGIHKYSLANWRDITAHKQAEEKLRESEAFTTNLLGNMPNPVISIYPDTSIRYVNPAFEKLTGYTLDEIIGMKVPHPWWPARWKKGHTLLSE